MSLERDKTFISWKDNILHVDKGLVPGMKVPGRLYVSRELSRQLLDELEHFHNSSKTSFLPAIYQIGNAASLPGILGASIALPDVHTGYGFAIGHVAAFDLDDPLAVVSPGGVGFDINCGVRMLRSEVLIGDLEAVKNDLADAIFDGVPVGIAGKSQEDIGLGELRNLIQQGMRWAVEKGYAWPEDMERCEEGGCISFTPANPLEVKKVNQRAQARGIPQLGTLGSGNHYVEVQHVTEIFDKEASAAMGIHSIGQVCVMIHCGSRGYGHQIATDSINKMTSAMKRDNITLNDPMLACTRISSEEGQMYLKEMSEASNFAYVNRSVIASNVRKAFEKTFGKSAQALGLHTIYDVAHNIAKIEKHVVDGVEKTLLVHRKGATRAFPPHHPDLPKEYKAIGQPVLVGGSMGTCSYVLTGTEIGMRETFGSTCHGAGRAFGRHVMREKLSPEAVIQNLDSKGIVLRVGNPANIAEEAPESYKDVTEVVDLCHNVGISKKAFKVEPICVIKG